MQHNRSQLHRMLTLNCPSGTLGMGVATRVTMRVVVITPLKITPILASKLEPPPLSGTLTGMLLFSPSGSAPFSPLILALGRHVSPLPNWASFRHSSHSLSLSLSRLLPWDQATAPPPPGRMPSSPPHSDGCHTPSNAMEKMKPSRHLSLLLM
jgi:hypothetical protein